MKHFSDLVFGPHQNGIQGYERAFIVLDNGLGLSVCKRIKGHELFHPNDKTVYEAFAFNSDKITLPKGGSEYFDTDAELESYIQELEGYGPDAQAEDHTTLAQLAEQAPD